VRRIRCAPSVRTAPEFVVGSSTSESNDRRDSGDSKGAHKILMDLCQADLRCLDAHSHLGNLVFQQMPKDAIRHYEVGVRIGELSLGEGFAGLLPWGWIDIGRFSAACKGSDCASGVLAGSRRLTESSTACSG
jgi:hypothetical protein